MLTVIHDCSFDQLARLAEYRIGRRDIPCPFCSPYRKPENRRKKVARVWYDGDFASLFCVHCEAKVWGRADNGRVIASERMARAKAEAAKFECDHAAAQLRKARYFWSHSTPIQGTIAERYLRSARGIKASLPATLRFLAPKKPEHHPAMIAPFGLAIELEPEALSIDTTAIRGIHLTLLKPDGSGKAKLEDGNSKIMIGRSLGSPIVVAPNNNALGLLIAEGIETGLSGYQESGLGTWAAGSAGRMPALADAVPSYVEVITIATEGDLAGLQGAVRLATKLAARGIEARLAEVTHARLQ
jgi:Toprim domain